MKRLIPFIAALVAGAMLTACSEFENGNDSQKPFESSTQSSVIESSTPLYEESDEHDETSPSQPDEESLDDTSSDVPSEEPSDEPVSEESSTDETSAEESSEETSKQEYADIDFKSWQKINKDIYAWIRIPGTVIDYPILNRPGDNSRYLKRNYYGYADTRGSIFTEDYNSRDFSDPVTLVYGHNMSSGSMFGSIQKTYTKKSFMDTHKELLIIMPDVTYTYEIFAAIPYSNVHLMYYYDFTNPFVFDEVIKDMCSVRAVNAVVDRNVKVTSSDHVVILSTCMTGNDSMRYLLLAVRKDS